MVGRASRVAAVGLETSSQLPPRWCTWYPMAIILLDGAFTFSYRYTVRIKMTVTGLTLRSETTCRDVSGQRTRPVRCRWLSRIGQRT